MSDLISVDYERAGEITGYSKDVIRRAVDRGDLVARYENSKPVIEVDELRAWVASLPTSKPARRAS